MSLQDELSKHMGFHLPHAFVNVVKGFSEKTGNLQRGLELLEEYLGLAGGMQNSLECRYESTPIEFFPFLSSGGDGVMYGYVIHAPELNHDDYPIGVFIPGENEGVIHIGDSTRLGLENLISYIHGESVFAEVDLDLLDRLEIRPTTMKARQVFKMTEGRYARPMPTIPSDFQHVMTSDGAGIVAHRSQFRQRKLKKWTYKENIEHFLMRAADEVADGFLGTALYHLKEGWWMKYHSSEEGNLKVLKDRIVFLYQKLGKALLSQTMEKHFDWIG